MGLVGGEEGGRTPCESFLCKCWTLEVDLEKFQRNVGLQTYFVSKRLH